MRLSMSQSSRGLTGIGAAIGGIASFTRGCSPAPLLGRGAFCHRTPGVRSAHPGLFSVAPPGPKTPMIADALWARRKAPEGPKRCSRG